jgi:hypothetical protein
MIKEHISYSNYYIGMPSHASSPPPESLQSIEQSLADAKRKLDELVNAVANTGSLRSSVAHASTADVVQVKEVADRAYGALQHCLDVLREQDKVRFFSSPSCKLQHD